LKIDLIKSYLKSKLWQNWRRAFEFRLKLRDRLRLFADIVQSKMKNKQQRDLQCVLDTLAWNTRLWRHRKDVLLRLEERLDFFRAKSFRLLHAFAARGRRSLIVLSNVFNRK